MNTIHLIVNPVNWKLETINVVCFPYKHGMGESSGKFWLSASYEDNQRPNTGNIIYTLYNWIALLGKDTGGLPSGIAVNIAV